ncbi:MAG: S41 family peptidase [Gemmatimonadaceae bacterium]
MRRTFFSLAPVTLLAACQTAPHAARVLPAMVPPARHATVDAEEREISAAVAAATFDSTWAKVRNTYYDTTLKGLDWNAVRRELRPRAERAATRAQLRAVLMDMLGRLGDSHMSVLPREFTAPAPNDSADEGRPGGVGIEARIIGRSLVVWRVDPNGPAARAGVRPGWTIDWVDGTRPEGAIAELGAERDARVRRTLSIQVTARLQHRFEGPAKSRVEAAFRDDKGEPQRLALVRAPLAGHPINMGHMPVLVVHASSHRMEHVPVRNSCIGVMRFNYWLLPVMTQFSAAMNSFANCAGVVVDLRGNVGGLAAMLSGVSGFLADTAATLAFVQSRGQEIRYDVFPRRANAAGEPARPFGGAVAILIDPLTVSTSEVFAAGMRQVTQGRTRVFGQRSAGQALPALVYKLPTGDVLMHAIGDLRLADGTRIEGEGVRPDVEVPLRQSDLFAGRDAALDAAVRWIGAWNKRAGGA